MEVRNCPECGKLFNYLRTNLCPECQKKDEEEYLKVRAYLKKHPNIPMDRLSEETDTDEEKISRWIVEGKIESRLVSGTNLRCERCGADIVEGRFCSKCVSEMRSGFARGTQTSEKQESAQSKGVGFHTKKFRS